MEKFVGGLLSSIQGPINNASNIFFQGADGSAHVVQDLSSFDGTELIGYKSRIGGLWAKLSEAVSPFDHGAVGNFVNDDTLAVQAAINEAMTRRVPLLLNGDFAVTQAVISDASGRTILSGGTLTGLGG